MKTFLSLFQLFPAILDGVLKLQPVAIPGQSKKSIILHVIDVAAQIGENVPIPLVNGISLLIDKIAGTLSTPPEVPKP